MSLDIINNITVLIYKLIIVNVQPTTKGIARFRFRFREEKLLT